MKRYCYRCGSEISEDSLFCHKCGFRMEPVTRPAQKETLDCRQTKFAIYLSEEQAAKGGIVKYYIEEAHKSFNVDIESGIVNGSEKIIECRYIDYLGKEIKEIRHVKIVVGESGPSSPDPYKRTGSSDPEPLKAVRHGHGKSPFFRFFL